LKYLNFDFFFSSDSFLKGGEMEAVLQTKGLLSLPSNPRLRVVNSFQNGLRQRLTNPIALKPKSLQGLCLSSHGFQKFHGVASNTKGFAQNLRNFPICRAEAAAAADGQALFRDSESPKLLGIELATIKKIIPLGLMFFCILFNYTILRDTKDVLVVTAKGSSAEIIPFLKLGLICQWLLGSWFCTPKWLMFCLGKHSFTL